MNGHGQWPDRVEGAHVLAILTAVALFAAGVIVGVYSIDCPAPSAKACAEGKP